MGVFSHWDNSYYVDSQIYSLTRCEVCGLVEIENKPEPAALARYYQRNYYSYDTSNQLFFRLKAAAVRVVSALPRLFASRMIFENLYAFAPAGSEASVLDVGCGDGSALRAMKELGFTRLSGTEIDPARRAVLERQGIEVVITSDVTTAGFPKGAFDVVRLSHVLEHLYNPSATIGSCRDLLKNGGRLLLAVPNFDSPARRLFGRYFCGLQLPTHLYHFNKDNLRRLLAQHQLRVQRMYTSGYSGFSASLVTLLKDRYRFTLPTAISNGLIVALAPLDAFFNLLGQGYIITVEATRT